MNAYTPLHASRQDDTASDRLFVARETSSYLTSTARSTTVANLLAPGLAILLFWEDADRNAFIVWLAYMVVATAIRTWKANRLESDPAKIEDPFANLRITTWCVGLIGAGWGLGWFLVAPHLSMVNRLIYLFVTTGAMFSGMFGFGVHRPAFYSLCIPILVPAVVASFWPGNGFPWPFALGILTLFIYVMGISGRFSRTFEDSLRLRLRNLALYQELVSERDASVAANIAKSRFIASASHDLRQPMHAVNLYLESQALAGVSAPAQQVITKIQRSVTNLNQMFESLLDVSKLDAFTLKPDHESFRLRALAGALEEFGAPLAASRSIGFGVHLEAQPWVVGDMALLRQVLQNLIANAVHYTVSGRVDVHFDVADGLLVVAVKDTGIGIGPQDQAQIFTEFYRVSESRSRHDGLGLGLAIVKRLCDLIDARIEVQSQVGQGSVFSVHTHYPVSETRDAVGVPQGEPSQAPPQSLAGKVVAIVEDDANITEAYRQTLSQRGARVVVLSEHAAQRARELAEIDTLDFIISDFRLTQGTGDIVIQELRESFNRHIPAIIVTADTSPSHITYFRELNVPVLHKPISFQRVLDTVEQVLREQAAR